MKTKIINQIIKEMKNDLNEKQKDKLTQILKKNLENLNIEKKNEKIINIENKENIQLIKTFLSAKKSRRMFRKNNYLLQNNNRKNE